MNSSGVSFPFYNNMSIIEVHHLQKTFQSKRKAAGLGGSMPSLFKSEYNSIEAVRRLSFHMEAGEIVEITISDPPLEEVIAKIYKQAKEA